jgi:hypothetical protein
MKSQRFRIFSCTYIQHFSFFFFFSCQSSTRAYIYLSRCILSYLLYGTQFQYFVNNMHTKNPTSFNNPISKFGKNIKINQDFKPHWIQELVVPPSSTCQTHPNLGNLGTSLLRTRSSVRVRTTWQRPYERGPPGARERDCARFLLNLRPLRADPTQPVPERIQSVSTMGGPIRENPPAKREALLARRMNQFAYPDLPNTTVACSRCMYSYMYVCSPRVRQG